LNLIVITLADTQGDKESATKVKMNFLQFVTLENAFNINIGEYNGKYNYFPI